MMSPNEVKAELALRGVKQVEIARAVGISAAQVNRVIARLRRNAEVEREVARRLGKPVTKVFGKAA